jgi:parallel beta-helix repeat protein
LSGLSVGPHHFRVRATGLTGSTDATPAFHPWIVEMLPPPNCGPTTIVLANSDAWLDQSDPGKNTATDSDLKVLSKGPNQNNRTVIRFPLPAQPDRCVVQSATLRLFAASASAGRTLQALRITAPWNENSVTWGNQPATTSPAATAAAAIGYVEWNVTSQVQAMLASGNHHGFLIRDASENGAALEQKFFSREKGEGRPELVIAFAPAPATDTVAPVTTIESRPDLIIASSAATFAFSANEELVTYECSLDGSAFAACVSPLVISNLALGQHTFLVRAVDAAGNEDPTPASHVWSVVDALSLTDTTILLGPELLSPSMEAVFEFAGTDNTTVPADLLFQCSLDTQPFAPCTSPHTVSGLSLGQHTFRVRSVDQEANVDPTPATYNWTVDTSDRIAPDTTIIAGPPATTGLIELGLAFMGFDNVTPSLELTFECSLNGEPFAPCEVPHIVEAPEPGQPAEPGMVTLGLNQFAVRAIDSAGNVDPTPAMLEFTYVGPPVTTFTSGPGTLTPPADVGEPYTGGNSASQTAAFTFTNSQADVGFLCSLNGLPFVPCGSPYTLNGLLDGETYEFAVIATNSIMGGFELEPATYEWTVLLPTDIVPPNTTILSGPSGFNASENVVFTFSGTDQRSPAVELDFQCWLNGVSLGGCSSPFELEATGMAEHRFEVAAMDEAGNVDPTPAVRIWRLVDVTPPDTSIDSGPDSVEPGQPVPPEQQGGIATFTFSGFEELSGEAVFNFECSLDGADFVPCTSPLTITNVPDGNHVMMVRAVDAAGNPDPTPEIWDWMIESLPDTTAPDTVILGVVITPPVPGSGNGILATIAFSATEAGVEFECALDGAAFESCEMPHELEGLAPGPHHILVRAIDVAGNVDLTPASENFEIGPAPQTTILTGPSSPSESSVGSFTFSSDIAGSTFLCSLDGGEFIACTSPHGVQVLDEEEGPHTLQVQAVSPLGIMDATPASFTWTVGLPPETEITGVLYLDLTDLAEPNSLRFQITGSDDRTPVAELGFECSLDDGAFEGCDFLHYVSFDEMSAGDHTLAVRAVDASGNVDPTPALHGWSIAPTPETTIVSGPADQLGGSPEVETTSTSATFSFTSDQTNATFECSLDLAPYAPCVQGVTFDGLAMGEHSLTVRALNTNSYVNNVDLTPAEFEWVVGTMDAAVVTIESGPGTLVAPAVAGDPYLGGETSATNATFAFSASIPGLMFLCSLDGAPFVACVSPVSYTEAQLALGAGLAIGAHAFEVEAVQPALLVESTNAAYEWTVIDVTPPETTITLAPAALTGSPTATFEFTGSDNGTLVPNLEFECSLDGAAYAPCNSPHQILELTAGAHTFAVRAVDEALNADATPASHTWTVESGLVFCGQVLTNSIVIANDLLDCPEHGLVIGAAGITVDLNGHTIDGVGVTNETWAGILNEGFDKVTLTDSAGDGVVRDFHVGVQVGSGAVSNLVTLLNVQTNQIGILLASAGNGLDSNTVLSNQVAGNVIGILLADGTELAVVYGNTVQDNSDQGIRVESSITNRIEANVVSGSPGANVMLTDGSDFNTVTGNTLTGSAGYGLVIMDGSEANRIEANTASQNSGGIGVFNSVTNELVANLVQHNTTGILVSESSDNALVSNDVTLNGTGIKLLGSTGNQLESNDASQSVGDGIVLANNAEGVVSIGNVLLLNTASSNGGNGIVVSSEAPAATPPELLGNLLAQNTADGNAGDGIRVTAAGHSLTSNSANDNDAWGILAAQGNTDGGDNVATGNAQAQQCFGVVCNGSGGNDVTPPDTVIASGPDATTTATTAAFAYLASEQASLFECSLDGAAFAPCLLNPVIYQDLGGGTHSFVVRATDLAGNVDPSPATNTWTIVLPPETTILSGPDEFTASTSASFTFSSSDAGATFECRYAALPTVLESVAFAPCTSPFNLSGLALGEYEFEVRAISPSGLSDLSADDHDWEVVPPEMIPPIAWAAPGEIVYGTALEPAHFNATSPVAGTFTFDPPVGTILNAGTGQRLTATFTPADAVNYVKVDTSVVIDVARRGLTISATCHTNVCGLPLPPLTATYDGFVNGYTVGQLDAPVALATTATQTSPPGSYPITINGAVDANYSITFVPGELTVTLAPSPVMTITLLEDGSVRLRFEGVPTLPCRVEFTESLAVPDWQLLTSGAVSESGMFECVDEQPPVGSARYYRAVYP